MKRSMLSLGLLCLLIMKVRDGISCLSGKKNRKAGNNKRMAL